QELEIHEDGNLYCYWVPAAPGISLDAAGITDHLSGSLPGYMIPAYFVRLDEIPLTPNGKVNLAALPGDGVGEVRNDYTAPANEVERKLVEIWSQVLGIDENRVGIKANFFRLGGHSLRASIVVTRIHKELKVKIPLVEIFKTPTIAELSRYIYKLETRIYEDIQPVEKRE
ncbi:MAG: hypothetical protein GY940_00945, partial [bacterium]|nr:hypothetical protein [bacterium]